MRRLGLCLLCFLLLTLIGCGSYNNPEMPAETNPSAPKGIFEGQMSDTARAYNITAENYPKIDGSTSTLAVVQAIFRAMYGEEAAGSEIYPVKASKTVPSYEMLIDGKVDLILVPYASQEVLDRAKKAGVELEFHKFAAEALVFITSADNPTENITYEQVRSIYLDYGIKNWGELGGPADKKIVPICRNSDSGSQSQLDNLILHNEPIHPAIKENYVELTMEGMLEQVAFYHTGGISGKPTNSYALGYTLYTYLQNMNEITGIGERLKILNFDGHKPNSESIADGSYTLTDGYYAVVRKDIPADHPARSIIKWLQSEEGRKAVEELGLSPVNN